MSLAVGDGGPSAQEVERLRLTLSTYQDGTGMLVVGARRSLPGWRDFERSVALTFDGRAVESKEIFDVLIPFDDTPEYGISCKMRSTLKETEKSGRVTMELSNSSAKFTLAFEGAGISAGEFRDRATDLGGIIIATVASWHHDQSDTIDLERSSYLALSYDSAGRYQLHQFALDLPDPASLTWSFPEVKGKGGVLRPGKRLRGALGDATVLEFYYGSGGQLKYYPHIDEAIWKSEVFHLESLDGVEKLYDAEAKAAEYFPEKWKATYE